MDLASVVAALASVGVRVSGSTPNSSVQVDSSRACPTGLAGPEPSGTFHDPGQHFQAPTQDYHSYTHTLLGVVEDQVVGPNDPPVTKTREHSAAKQLWPNRARHNAFPLLGLGGKGCSCCVHSVDVDGVELPSPLLAEVQSILCVISALV